MDQINYKELANLSPFELKNTLIDVAQKSPNRAMLNAGRGNPNFLATIPRHGFLQFGLFAMDEADEKFSFMPEGVGGFPNRDGIEARFEIFTRTCRGVPGVDFIRKCVSFVRDQLGLSAGDFIYEMCEAILGCNYPVPDRMLALSEKIVNRYIRKEMIDNHPFEGEFDLFATEGGTAAMTYIFDSLKENDIIVPGDSIALGLPIFTPYIEIPKLNDYELVEIGVNAEADDCWQFPTTELDKLLDPKIKAFFLVNPSNPPSVRLSDENLKYLQEIVKKRPDLIILTDDVYGTFADDFLSLFAVCPQNTILVYSFSKYFGATGWRMGVIAMHQNNIIDQMIAKLPDEKKNQLIKRYESIATDPEHLKFIDRMVADSRTVALNHTAGLATPVQAQMVLFSIFAMMDIHDSYKVAMKRLIRKRNDMLYRGFGGRPPQDEDAVDYYQLLDVGEIYRETYGDEFADWYLKALEPNAALFRLAGESGVVLLPAEGFGTTHQ
ncbi:MAG: bifunctional aspartate transaminase/aspartate 4-decarboxylase, partial [Planctomycetes bacterium]|nr:bifunctional aspartate transaminase/aspartate 4-decarboxylase [Planctomycetota bacterium]